MEDINLNTIFLLVVSGLITWAITGIRANNATLRDMNGSVREIKEWMKGHEKLDDERSANFVEKLKSLAEVISLLKSQ